jgi:hypothetical protein
MMKASELKECSYFLVRYVPDVVKGEFINIGVFLFCPAEQFLGCSFSDDWRRVNRFHAQADSEFLEDLQSHFKQQIEEHKKDLDGYVREMQQSYSNLIELSPPRKCLTADLDAQLHELFDRYVGARLTAPPEQDARMRIRHRLTESLRRCGVLGHKSFEKGIPALRWSGAGDPFVFDFGYEPLEPTGKPNGRGKLIHTLSLKKDPKLAKELRLTFDRVRVKGPSHLTVGHEDILDPDDAVVRFSQDVLQDEHIRLVPVSGFDEYAQRIRAELPM